MSLILESEIDARELRLIIEREEIESSLGSRKPSEVLRKVYIAASSIFSMALYFCALKYATMVSEISEFEIMFHRSFWGLMLIMFF